MKLTKRQIQKIKTAYRQAEITETQQDVNANYCAACDKIASIWQE